MSEPQIFILRNPHIRANASNAVYEAPEGYAVRIIPPTRSLEQNAFIHAALTEIAKQVVWNGQKFEMEVWKRLCMAAWLREKGGQPMLIPALDGKGFDIVFERTSKLTVAQCAEFIEWIHAFAAQHNVVFSQ